MNQGVLLEQTKILCKQLDIAPTKSKGQNFLVSEEVLNKIIEVADLQAEDSILEIGPGLGILTERLVQRAKRVVAVELDKKLFVWLQNKFQGVKNLELVEGDIIKLFHGSIVPLLGEGKYKVVANLPYQITSHILRILLEADKPPSELVLMVQKEVGERICTKKGDMSILSVMVQYYSRPEIVSAVGRENFWPKPEVDSAIVKIITPGTVPLVKGEGDEDKVREENLFFKLVRIGFSGKRKMLKNNLRNVYQEEVVLSELANLGLDAKVRAEDLGVEEWVLLYDRLAGR